MPGTQLNEVSVDGKILHVINGDLGNADTSYTYFNLGRDGYKHFTLQLTIQATTITLEATNDNLSVTDANATWTDVTLAITGQANFTSSDVHVQDTSLVFGRFRIKRVTTNATNACDLILSRGN